MIALIWFVLAILASPFKSKSRLEAENAVLRYQLIVLRRKMRGRPQLRNNAPLVLHTAVSLVSINPTGSHDHPPRDAGALASSRLSRVLGLEVAPTGRAATDRERV